MCQQPRHVLSLCPLNLILSSSLSNQEGRCYSSPGVGSTCQFASSYKSSQDDIPLLQYVHLLISPLFFFFWKFFLETWGSSLDFFLSLVYLGDFLALFLPFESTLEYPVTRAGSLECLMVPIITNLSCSCVRDSMKSARLRIF